MAKRHFVVSKAANGKVELHPMKAWLRDNPQHVPPGLDASGSTSWELRRGLRIAGWELKELGNRVFVIRPDEGDTSFAYPFLVDEPPDDDGTEKVIEEAEEITLGLERDLQSALRTNIAQLEPGLVVSDGGRERQTVAGRIDITTKDGKGNVVVVELKAGTASPDTVAQILAYMTAVAEEDQKEVRGIVVAADFHKRVMMAARAVPTLALKRYRVQFRFEAVE
jgi:hypothetical protein